MLVLVRTWFRQWLRDFLRISLPAREEWALKDHLVEVVKILMVKTCTADGKDAERKEKSVA